MNIITYGNVEYDLDENRNYEIEEWRPINIGNIKPDYYISDMGRVKNIDNDSFVIINEAKEVIGNGFNKN
jgi:hypothetical protein